MGFKTSRLHGLGIMPIKHYFRKTTSKLPYKAMVTNPCIPLQRKDGRWDCMVRKNGDLRLCPTVGPFETREECLAAFCF